MEQTIPHYCDTGTVDTYAGKLVPAYSSAFISILCLTSAVLLHNYRDIDYTRILVDRLLHLLPLLCWVGSSPFPLHSCDVQNRS
jgi:hypothetical protein